MNKRLSSIFLAFSIATTLPCYAKGEPLLFGHHDELRIVVNNRILAKVNGKSISVFDLMKKMDMLFYRQFPEYTTSVQARYQFYQANWEHVLTELIDKELIAADAVEAKLQVNNGDVRQEMEQLFGPNIITNLDKVGLSYEEASKMLHAEITIRRMLYFRAQSKAIKLVTPQSIRDTYEEFSKANKRDAEWQYQVISIRDQDPSNAADTAHLVHQMLSVDKVTLDQLPTKLKEHYGNKPCPAVNISEENLHNEKELSEAYKSTLNGMQAGAYSIPLAQKSRADNAMVFRIFYLKAMTPGGVIPFKEIESKIKDKLTEEAIAKETEAYLTKLRQHFDVQETRLKEVLSEDQQLFSLK